MISIQTIYHIWIYMFVYDVIYALCLFFSPISIFVYTLCVYFFPENTLSKGSKMDRGPVFTTKRSIRY